MKTRHGRNEDRAMKYSSQQHLCNELQLGTNEAVKKVTLALQKTSSTSFVSFIFLGNKVRCSEGLRDTRYVEEEVFQFGPWSRGARESYHLPYLFWCQGQGRVRVVSGRLSTLYGQRTSPEVSEALPRPCGRYSSHDCLRPRPRPSPRPSPAACTALSRYLLVS